MWPGSWRAEAVLRVLGAAAACTLLIALLGWKIVNRWLDEPLAIDAPVLAEIPEGGNLTGFLDELSERGVLAHPNWLRAQARISGVADRVRAGEYLIEPGTTPRALLKKLSAGDVVVYVVTLVEGMTVEQVLARLHQQPKLKRMLPGASADSLPVELGMGGEWKSAEGAFFPDTYQYSLGMSDADVLRASNRALERVLAQEWEGRDPDTPYATPYEALIMASLVEKETGVAAERRDIAGVFVRRLAQGMLLQTDPAVIYGLGQEFGGNLTREHLRAPGAYNTYMNPGLPPSPIAIPGRDSINAALHPAEGSALYFVARGDGSHEFSATLEQHNRAVRRYQLKHRDAARRSRASP
jgi:UPF0755 protein